MSVRIRVDRGVILYRHGQSWWLDIHQDGRRIRKSLSTSHQGNALKAARELASGIVSRRWNVAAAQNLTVETALTKYRESVNWSNLTPVVARPIVDTWDSRPRRPLNEK